MPLQLPLAFISFFGHADGVVDGTVTANGTLAEPDLGGSLVVSEARVDLRTLGQRLRDVHGEVRIHDDRLELHDFEARDGDGRAGIDGEIDLHGFSPHAMHLRLDSEKFPVREDSTIIATLTGHAGFEASL